MKADGDIADKLAVGWSYDHSIDALHVRGTVSNTVEPTHRAPLRDGGKYFDQGKSVGHLQVVFVARQFHYCH